MGTIAITSSSQAYLGPKRPRSAATITATATTAFLLLLLLAVPASAGIITPRVLHAGNIDALTSTGTWLILFHAPWCKFCTELKPHFAAAAGDAAGHTTFATVDCTEARSVCTRFGVGGYPTLLHVTDGGGAPAVRVAAVEHTRKGIVEYARGGWAAFPASSFGWGSHPYGPWWRAVGATLRGWDAILAAPALVAASTGVDLVIVQFVALIVGVLLLCVLLVVGCVCAGPSRDGRRMRGACGCGPKED